MRNFFTKLALLMGALVAVDLLVPGVGQQEIELQAFLVAAVGAGLYFGR